MQSSQMFLKEKDPSIARSRHFCSFCSLSSNFRDFPKSAIIETSFYRAELSRAITGKISRSPLPDCEREWQGRTRRPDQWPFDRSVLIDRGRQERQHSFVKARKGDQIPAAQKTINTKRRT